MTQVNSVSRKDVDLVRKGECMLLCILKVGPSVIPFFLMSYISDIYLLHPWTCSFINKQELITRPWILWQKNKNKIDSLLLTRCLIPRRGWFFFHCCYFAIQKIATCQTNLRCHNLKIRQKGVSYYIYVSIIGECMVTVHCPFGMDVQVWPQC